MRCPSRLPLHQDRGVTGLQVGLIVLSAVLGGGVQATLGFGASFIMVPVVAVISPEAVPASVLVGLLPVTIQVAWRDRDAIDRSAFLRITAGRIPGTVAGTAVVALAPPRVLILVIAGVLLLAVAATAVGLKVRTTTTSQVVSGVASGFTGTAAALGGPPLALLYRDAAGANRRGTLSAIFAFGIIFGLATLAVAGEFDTGDLATGVWLGMSLVAGAVLAAPLVRRLSDEWLRRAVLIWAAVGAVTALIRAFV
jgi:uncharacterized membrane protein YfcA